MAFFTNGAVNRVNLHSGVQALAQGAGQVFYLVVLLRAGVPVPLCLLAIAATVAARFTLRPAILPIVKRTGLKPTLITGILILALQYPVLAAVRGVGPGLLALILVSSVGEVFYWVSYNAYFSAVGDAEHRGRQIGAREALVAAVGVVAPLIGGWALTAFGPTPTFAAIGLVQAASALPLLGAPNVAVQAEAPGAFRSARLAMAIIAMDGWFDAGFFFVWQIGLFLTLRQSYAAYGGAMALAGLVGAAGGVWLGARVDAGHGRRAVVIAYGAAALVIAGRAASLGVPWLAVAANAAGALTMPLLIPTLASATYNLAKASPCPLRFQIMCEAGWDLGCFGACVVGAGLAALGAPLQAGVLTALPAAAVGGVLLWRHFGRGPLVLAPALAEAPP
ncbi:MAG TPA: MFS transporter [Caulobacteraceae bacterium]|nr:MFS transporter [Caulobacteraceae bacterium]